MAEAAVAIGVAGSIVTFVEVGTKVLARLREFHSITKEAPGVFRDITTQLPLIIDIMTQIEKRCEDGSLAIDAQDKLSPVVEGCRRQVDMIDKLIERMLPAPTDSTFRRARKAVASVRKEKDITRIQSTLNEYKLTLTVYAAVATPRRKSAEIHKDLKRQFQRWLKPLPNVRDFHERRFTTKLRETCDWIWVNQTFVNWNVASSSLTSDRLLYIYGTHGCGKTVLASSIIEGLKRKQLRTLFFYFSGTDPNLQSLGDLVRTFLWQLLEETTDKRSLEIVDELVLKGPPAFSELLDALKNVAALVTGRVYCVIDGVDECSDTMQELHQYVLHLLEANGNFRAVLLGRQHVFQAVTGPTAGAIEINSTLIKQDIDALISAEVDAKIDAGILMLSGLRDSIVETLQEKSGGMLLWIKLMVDDLRTAATEFEIKKSLHSLPCGLEEAYRRIFLRLVKTLKDPELVRARRILAFAIVSCRTLELDELRYAYALDSGSCSTFEEHLLMQPVRKILDVCGNFINIKDGLVQLVHYSVKEFLTRPEDEWLRRGDKRILSFRVDLEASHRSLGLVCFDYLRMVEYGSPLHDTENRGDAFLGLETRYPFLKYASRFTITHLNRSGPLCSVTLDKLRDFLESGKWISWIEYVAMMLLEDVSASILVDEFERFESLLDKAGYKRELFWNELQMCLNQELAKRIRTFGEHDPRTEQCQLFLDMISDAIPNADAHIDSSRESASRLRLVSREPLSPSHILNVLNSNSTLPLHRQVDMLLRLQSHLQRLKVLTSPLKMLFRIILQKAPIIPVYVLLAVGGFYHRLEKLEEALDVYRAALAKVEGQEIPIKFIILGTIGRVLIDQGKYEAAEEMHRQALEGMEKVLGMEHPDTLTSAHSLGWALCKREKCGAAEDMYRRVVEGREKVLGVEHPRTLTSVHNLGWALHEQKKYEAAEDMHRRVMEGREKVLGMEHPRTLTSVHDLGCALYEQKKYEAAEDMYRRVVKGGEKVPGMEHPDMLTSVHNLGWALYKQKKYEAAKDMYRRVVEGREKVLGMEHPDTLTSVHDLGCALYEQKKYEAAEDMYRRVVEGREKVLGMEHPDTLTSVYSLGGALDGQGKYEAAEEMYRRAWKGGRKC